MKAARRGRSNREYCLSGGNGTTGGWERNLQHGIVSPVSYCAENEVKSARVFKVNTRTSKLVKFQHDEEIATSREMTPESRSPASRSQPKIPAAKTIRSSSTKPVPMSILIRPRPATLCCGRRMTSPHSGRLTCPTPPQNRSRLRNPPAARFSSVLHRKPLHRSTVNLRLEARSATASLPIAQPPPF